VKAQKPSSRTVLRKVLFSLKNPNNSKGDNNRVDGKLPCAIPNPLKGEDTQLPYFR
jgi:hypothetical protein